MVPIMPRGRRLRGRTGHSVQRYWLSRRPTSALLSAVAVRRFAAARLFGFEVQRRRIDAIAQALGPGPVGEDMAEMALAARAAHFGADHAVAACRVFSSTALAWPAR